MGDRDRLDALARQRLAEREAAAARREEERAATAARADARRAGFDDLAGWCERTFAGYALPETGHVLGVGLLVRTAPLGVQWVKDWTPPEGRADKV